MSVITFLNVLAPNTLPSHHPVGTNFILQTISLFHVIFDKVDPSLFQNVLLTVLAILVPVGVGVFSHFFQQRAEGKVEANLELFILLSKILHANWLVTLAITNLFLFSLAEISFGLYVFAILFFISFIFWVFFVPFRNIWKWFLENPDDFATDYLKTLKPNHPRTMILAWRSVWIGHGKETNGVYEPGLEYNKEFVLTKIFIRHIDKAIQQRQYALVVELARIYLENLNSRNHIWVGGNIFPKALEWSEKF